MDLLKKCMIDEEEGVVGATSESIPRLSYFMKYRINTF